MNVVGLDLSLVATGYCHPDGSTEAIKPKVKGVERLVWLRDEILDRIPAPMTGREPDVVAIEGYSFNSRAGGEHLGELGGVIRVALHELGVPYIEVAPATLKKYATGRGNAKKDDMRMERYKRSGVDEKDDNQTDAWWLHQLGLCWLLDDREPTLSIYAPAGVATYVRMPAANRTALIALVGQPQPKAVAT